MFECAFVVYFDTVACFVAFGACPVVGGHGSVAVCRWCADDESAKAIVEKAVLHVYLGYVYCLCVAQRICKLVLSGVALFYADEFAETACLVVGVYGAVKDESYRVVGVGAVVFARNHKCGKQQYYQVAESFHFIGVF